MPRIGVLAFQGDVREHQRAIEAIGVKSTQIRRPAELENIDGLVIPGGESTTIANLATRFEMVRPLQKAINSGLPTLGTCAGLIFLAAGITEGEQPLLGVLDVVVQRNAFGRQNESFEADLTVLGLDEPFHAVFIRAPWVAKIGEGVEVLASFANHPVMVRQDKVLGSSFHPELTGDPRLHKMLLDLI